ncbi:helix-turn-helix transcriptional regulator [Megasphaera vaginalis (ex Srinivasan et al. 2021)]|uniref:DNA-binding helix-turn-helix protein n=1 Tax=Megasphaera vaginalis (ex Srinivasan et al. 2021) TaxID=1111454 RepID=U7UQN2_9FIRM|nr:helix-turn-helix transcriptional regulator [Megasphaera vaginalis (ex Srinivasan et al. 2021)]ERT60773.1 DNA-binding helix-turn-helix protein [Megasphaera vaginalis (ex Srinivasan et al. 2021)]
MKNKLKEFRKEKGMSQTTLAYETGVSQRYIAFIEDGYRTPSLRLALKISKVLGSTIDAIFLP